MPTVGRPCLSWTSVCVDSLHAPMPSGFRGRDGAARMAPKTSRSRDRVLLFERVTCTIQPDGAPRTFPEPSQRRRSAEEQAEAFLRQAIFKGNRWEWLIQVEVTAEDGRNFVVQMVCDRRFGSLRQRLASSLLQKADAPGTTPNSAQELSELVQAILGRNLEPDELPALLRPKRRHPVHELLWTRLPSLSHTKQIEPGPCICGRSNVPRVLGFQSRVPVITIALHAAPGGKFGPGLCSYAARNWTLLDAREAHTFGPDAPLVTGEPPPLKDRIMWLRAHLAAVPQELGGPLDGDLNRLLAMDGAPCPL